MSKPASKIRFLTLKANDETTVHSHYIRVICAVSSTPYGQKSYTPAEYNVKFTPASGSWSLSSTSLRFDDLTGRLTFPKQGSGL